MLDGPSPRAWGSLGEERYFRAKGRTIPTRVGITSWGCVNGAVGPDHPHARGDHPRASSAASSICGPSPRAWGSRSHNSEPFLDLRTIPTRVGITLTPPPAEVEPADHPHARGDHTGQRGIMTPAHGPSPRAWGSPGAASAGRRLRRTIPTRVGITYSAGQFISSGRTIPTRVGITTGSNPRREVSADHPHARGDHAGTPSATGSSTGPSPRAWGSRRKAARDCRLPRTIPTRVGITSIAIVPPGNISDHPHARGDHYMLMMAAHSECGPSPRAWGSRAAIEATRHYARTIPTRVGITIR